MRQRRTGARCWGGLFGFLLLCLCLASAASAQQTLGTVTVTVLDDTGAVLPGTQLTLTDLATNTTRTAITQEAGNYTFANLTFGQYKLTVSLDGFQTQSIDVLVQSARTTDVVATLKIGVMQDVVQVVGGVAPLVEATTNAINTTIDMKQIEDLPLAGRNIAQLSQLAAGYNGTWNGLPSAAQGNSVDGIIGNTNRWRYQSVNSALSTAITPRLENIAEMVISTDQMDMNQGFGNSGMQITYITRRGTNTFHGRLYEGYRSDVLNATNWGSTVKPKYHQNEFGASVGGPVLKDKLFFFASGSVLDVPGSSRTTRTFFADDAKQGIFTYAGSYKVNLFDIYKAYNAANGTRFPSSVSEINPMVQARIKEVDGYRQNAGVLSAPQLQPTDPNLRQWEWNYPNSQRTYYPTFRVDYNVASDWRLNVAYNQTKFSAPTAYSDHWPGDGRGAARKSNNASLSVGLDTTLSSNLLNEFRGGYLYTAAWFGIGGSEGFYTNPTIQYGYGGYDDNYEMPNSRKQPIFSVSDSVTWVKGSHTLRFGGNAYREVNKYWDPPEGFTLMSLGLVEGDPARDVLTKQAMQALAGPGAPVPTDAEWNSARQLYATLTGRISNFWGRHAYVPSTGTYATGSTPERTGVAFSTLDELLTSWGLFIQDSYRMKRNLTVNLGLRWDFVSPDKDRTGKYHSATPQDLFGPTAVGQLFKPGPQSLTGTFDPVYTAREAPYGHWRFTPQPAAGIAWTPRSQGNFFERLLGGDRSVVRTSFSMRRFTMPQQFVWDMGSSYGLAFYQNFSASPSTSGARGTFMPGSITLGGPGWLPQSCAKAPSAPACFVYSPQEYAKVIHMKDSTFVGGAAAAIRSDIRQPYVQSWTVGVQRDIGGGRAIEIRYNGNRTRNLWLAMDINEVNVFENGFLDEFKRAQKNLSINQAAGVNSFANRGLPGQADLPIMTAAGISFTNTTFINRLLNGQVGSFASTLATNRDYFCRMVGSSFEPCGATYGAGAGYPINFWMANPFAIGSWTGASYMDDRGFSNYHGLQVEFRQRPWHGMTMTANYTLSRTMGVQTAGDWTGSYTQFTVRDLKSSYMPASTDRRHVVHVNGTYDLPFGEGRRWLAGDGALERILGGWTVSTIITFQSGSPFRIAGNNNTFNNKIDGGLILKGITPQDIQDRVGLYFDKAGLPYFLPPEWIAQVKADGTIAANNVPGTWGQIFYLHGPHQTYVDIGISKSVPITRGVRFKFQMEMLNAFNHPTFGQGTTGLASTGFGRANQLATSRRIEFRANVEF
ncbi:MAG: carboxypeptidase regulatory-like domain-containing protein [Vicinamibacterales bacterium]